jgi:hypothetical protein
MSQRREHLHSRELFADSFTSGHYLAEEAPEETARELRAFFAK